MFIGKLIKSADADPRLAFTDRAPGEHFKTVFGIIPHADARSWFFMEHYRRNIRPFDFLIMSRKGSGDQ